MPSWYPMPEATDRESCWYRVQRTYRTRLQNGEIQGYRVQSEVKTHKKLEIKGTLGNKARVKKGTGGGRERAGYLLNSTECIKSPVLFRWDGLNSNPGIAVRLIMACVKCSFPWSTGCHLFVPEAEKWWQVDEIRTVIQTVVRWPKIYKTY